MCVCACVYIYTCRYVYDVEKRLTTETLKWDERKSHGKCE